MLSVRLVKTVAIWAFVGAALAACSSLEPGSATEDGSAAPAGEEGASADVDSGPTSTPKPYPSLQIDITTPAGWEYRLLPVFDFEVEFWKVVENSPPGRAQIASEFVWGDNMNLTPVGTIEGRNAPNYGKGGVTLHWSSLTDEPPIGIFGGRGVCDNDMRVSAHSSAAGFTCNLWGIRREISTFHGADASVIQAIGREADESEVDAIVERFNSMDPEIGIHFGSHRCIVFLKPNGEWRFVQPEECEDTINVTELT